MTLAPGARLGRYEIRSLLGAGGMGEVYLAFDHDLERSVAVKILPEESGGDRIRRFMQEAKATSALHHPNVAHVYEIGAHDRLHFIAMEYIEGDTLRARLSRGRMPVDAVLDLATQIAAAIAAAHKAGIVHRDLKPENVIITADGYAKVLDFGLAKLREIRGEDAATLVKTNPGVAMGTIAYMAPEQLVGGDVTPAADVFSLGVVFYEMLAGRRPFEGGTTSEVVTPILSKAPPPLQGLRADAPPKLEALVRKALAKNVDERYRDAGEMHEQLRLMSREGIVITPSVRRSRGVTLAVALVAAVIAIAGAGWWKLEQARARRDALLKIDAAESLVSQHKLA